MHGDIIKRFYVYDSGLGGECIVGRFKDIDDAIQCAERCIYEYRRWCDPEWPDDVEGIRIYEASAGFEDIEEEGILVARSVAFNIIDKPNDVDAEGYSPSTGLSFSKVDGYCDYRIERVSRALDARPRQDPVAQEGEG